MLFQWQHMEEVLGVDLELPENDVYEPIDGTEAELIGLVKAVVREY